MIGLIGISQPVVRKGFDALLRQVWSDLELATVDTFLRSQERLSKEPGDLHVVGLALPGLSGPAGLGRVRETHPAIKVHALGNQANRPVVLAGLSPPGAPDFAHANPPSQPNTVPPVANDPAAQGGEHAGKSSITQAIAALKREFAIEVANTRELILAAQRLCYQVYCVERGYETAGHGVEQDEFDAHSRHVVLRRRSDGEVVGTARLILNNPARPDDSYPTQRVCDSSLLSGLPMPTTAEISRFAVSRQVRGTSPALLHLALLEGLVRISHDLGLTDWCATMEPSLLRLLSACGIRCRKLGPPVEYHGLRQPCCAKVAEQLARMQAERPEIWAFVSNNGRYYGRRRGSAATSNSPARVAHHWQTTLAGAVQSAFYPTFQVA